MTNESLETVEKLFKLQAVDRIHALNALFGKAAKCSILKLKTMYCKHETYQRHMGL